MLYNFLLKIRGTKFSKAAALLPGQLTLFLETVLGRKLQPKCKIVGSEKVNNNGLHRLL